jgi:hypothetical protein
VDTYAANAGFPLAFAYTSLVPNQSATAAAVPRQGTFPIALGNAMGDKYRISASFKIIDPETYAPAITNPFLDAKPGVLLVDGRALDRLLARGVVFGVCNVAL